MTLFLAAVAASAAFSVLGAVPIITRTIRAIRDRPGPKARPQPVSWAVWAGIMIIGGFDAAKGGQVPAAVYGLACGGECMAIAALALLIPAADRDAPVMVPLTRRRKLGGDPERAIRLDWICGGGGGAGLVLLIAVRALSPSTAVLVATDGLAYIPTMVAGWRSPHDEVPQSYGFFAIGAGIALGIAHLSVFIAVAYPLYLLVADSAMTVITLASPHRRTAGQSASDLPASARHGKGPAHGPGRHPSGCRRGIAGSARYISFMSTPQREAGLQQPVTLLESLSPYGSRKVTVEYDGLVTAAYLHDAGSAVSAVWIANHQPALQACDRARLDAGHAPVMPAACTKHPRGRAPLQADTLDAVWFEEGDGVAILERGQPVAVIAGWSDADRGMPGYSRDVTSPTPFGWPLDEAMEGLAPKLERARSYWRWRHSDGGWGGFEQDMLGHLASRLGQGGHYWEATEGQQPLTGVTERPPGPGRPYTVLATVGMSCQRMPVVEQVLDDPGRYARIELAVATTLPGAQAARVFSWLAPYPWHAVTWFGPGHSVCWYEEPATFPLGTGAAVLLLESPGVLGDPEPPDLSGFTFGGDPVRWLWVVPISERDRQLAKERGTDSLVRRLSAERRSWITRPGPGSPVKGR